MATFKVINPGVLTTIQDLGRYGYQKYGLAVSGSVDQYAHRMANIIIGNPENAAVLETTLVGLKLKTLKSTVIVITGGDLRPKVNGKPVEMWKSFKVNKDDLVTFSGCRNGLRSYISIAGGVDVPNILGSKSTDIIAEIGGINGRKCESGDLIKTDIQTGLNKRLTGRRLPASLIPDYPSHLDVRVILGPQEQAFKPSSIKKFFSSIYTVGKEIDSMACRLDGPKIKHIGEADIFSEGMFAGAIQVPRDGLPIVFLHGRRSIGGYTKIGGVISVDLPRLAQIKTGDTIQFHQIEIEEAHKEYIKSKKLFNLLRYHNKEFL